MGWWNQMDENAFSRTENTEGPSGARPNGSAVLFSLKACVQTLLSATAPTGRRRVRIQGWRRLPRRLRKRDAKLSRHAARDVHHLLAGPIFVEKHLSAQDHVELFLGGHLVDRPLKLLQEGLHHFAAFLLHLLLALLGRLLELPLALLKLSLPLGPRGVVEQRLLLLELLHALLKLLSLLLQLLLLPLHFLLYLLLHILHSRHAHQDGLLVDVPDLLGLHRHRDHRREKKEKRKGLCNSS